MTEKEIEFINMDKKQYKKLYSSGQCSDCYYKMHILHSGDYMCGYCYLTGHRRKSLPPNCDKHKKRKKNFRRKSYINYDLYDLES